jgi:VanZ family protein
MTNKYIKIIISITVIAIALGLLLYQSLQEYNMESRDSKTLAQSINSVIIEIKGEPERSDAQVELIIRKCAHLLEYIFYTTVVFVVVLINVKRKWLGYLMVFVITIPIPFIDELIFQARTLGRSVSLLDIGIDLLGIAVAIIVGSLNLISNRILLKR